MAHNDLLPGERDRLTFDSRFTLGERFGHFEERAVKNEPMLFSAGYEFAIIHGGPITQSFLAALPEAFVKAPDFIFDSRVHMLMPGWYPAIPGWHHDDVPRGKDSRGQPDYDEPVYRSEHAMGLVNGEICPTSFAVGTITMPAPDPDKGPTYGQWHPVVQRAVEGGALRLEGAPSDRVVFFDWQAFHQGVAAVGNGWRWFGRASRNTHRKRANEIRRQVQVYLEHPMEGW